MTATVNMTNEYILISTHTPLAGRDTLVARYVGAEIISTHTPLAGRDWKGEAMITYEYISTHTPLAGRDPHRM